MLYLASKSPRRRELLERLGVPFGVLDLDIPEQQGPNEPADDYVRRVAREKAGAGLMDVMTTPGAIVLGADTEVILDDQVFGKPADRADAERMLRLLSGRTHRVLTAITVLDAGREQSEVSESLVTFDALDDGVITWYLSTGEWQGKAGAYAIQGHGERLIRRLEGNYSGVMGLPMQLTAHLLLSFGMHP
ncbi:Maf family protein [Luteimonas sp. FXH3W]|uniref:dTTP/UTP pyrophosphatase n=1 Tax=Aquilutibacter rugosus TaxID=3115820 RepID=A0ABU7V0Q1_9GAMM